jgi:Flp pilus assembly protein TadG
MRTRLMTKLRSDSGSRRMSPYGRRRMRGESGYVLAMTGMLLIPLLAFTAFAVDLGSWYAQASRQQRAADAAALAGVVWANDPIAPTKWDTVARDVATKNGYTDGVNGVTVATAKITKNQIQVTISRNGQQFFSKLFLPNGEKLTRTASAQFNLPIPLGSPRNFIGTAAMGTGSGAYAREGVAASINGYCTDKVQGDQKASKYFTLSTNTSAACSGGSNGDYSANNYEYYIELPASRAQPVDVLLFDPQYNSALSFGSFASDFNPGGQPQPEMSTTYTLFKADGTPLDDTDNPTMASQTSGNGCASTTAGVNGTNTFAPGATSASNSNFVFNPSAGSFTTMSTTAATSGWWQLCRIPTTAPPGKYILRVQNGGNITMGSNNYSVAASYTTQALCDARADAMCPKVYGKDFLSLRANGASATSDFYLAEIDASNASKKLTVTLWDPGEGASTIGLLIPTGANAWTPVNFTWQADDGTSGGPTTALDVTGSAYNGKLVTLTYTLTGYNPPATNDWWKIRYTTGGSAPTDHTTWAVNVVGDPVHLTQ